MGDWTKWGEEEECGRMEETWGEAATIKDHLGVAQKPNPAEA